MFWLKSPNQYNWKYLSLNDITRLFYSLEKIYFKGNFLSGIVENIREKNYEEVILLWLKIISEYFKSLMSKIKSFMNQLEFCISLYDSHSSVTRFHYFLHLPDKETKPYNIKLIFSTVINLIRGWTMPDFLPSNPVNLPLN